jgi:glycosyltransferase involved in cell wall biosynthesis
MWSRPGRVLPNILWSKKRNCLTSFPKISIVTPSYNQGQFLEECIDSILGQGYPNLEYVIMDGGSTDNSVDIIRKYEKHLTYWQSKPDGGQYAAINDGFGKTNGELMAWLNSDDKYQDNAFFKVAYLFSRHEELEWLTARHAFWDGEGRVKYIELNWLPEHSREKYLRKEYDRPYIQQESTFWRRTLWEKAGGFIRPDLKFAGDLELWTRFFRHAPLSTVDTLLSGYRMHGNQKVALGLDRYHEEAVQILDEEIARFALLDGYNPPAPCPIAFDPAEFTAFMRAACAGRIACHTPAAEYVIDYLLRNLTATGADRKP